MKKVVFIFLFLIGLNNVLAFSTSASCAVLMDMDSLNVIYSKNMHDVRSVASISKIMTAIVAIENSDLTDVVTVGDEILDAYGSAIYIKRGEQITLESLLYGLMLRSGNDASLAIAKYVGGDIENFVKMMNDMAIKIGMKNTSFNNPNGLEVNGGNLSTAYDMALLTSYANKNEVYKKIVSTKKYTVKTNMNYYSWVNKNKLLHQYNFITGGKTGFTEIARRTLVTTANQNDISLVAVTLNDGNDFFDHASLYKEAFSKYQNYTILKKGYIDILNEEYYKNKLYIKDDFKYTLLKNNENSVLVKYILEKNKNSDDVGFLEVYIDDKKVHTQKIYVTKERKLSFIDKVRNWIDSLW